ncbi:hypothetical protein [Neobacillus cucumis]|uniref:Uncharacterized protein n=1 Tax=Neobacillus cucumis TaxID=1740721 RepID=A0A2N5HAB8_9BACI|nr:hypothetical protein [Neobacillus cucumis]PLS02455.1 hypothetical protein CVD27_20095 [Neobacillus cucumis]
MANYFFEPETYPFMYKGTTIGFITIDMDSFGKYEYSLDLISYTSKNKIPWAFLDINENFISKFKNSHHHKSIIQNWIEERVFPPDRQASDELLKKVNLSEYDQLAIIKHTRASSRYDSFWIKFYPNDTFKNTILKKWDDKK